MKSITNGLDVLVSSLSNVVIIPVWGIAGWVADRVLAVAAKVPGLNRRLQPHPDPVAHVAAEACAMPAYADDLLVHGKLREYAEQAAPPAQFPWLYVDVPDDLRRSIAADGRLVNGAPMAPALAGLTVTPGLVEDSYRCGHQTGWRAGVAMLVALVLALAVHSGFNMFHASGNAEIFHAEVEAEQPAISAEEKLRQHVAYEGDLWSQAEREVVISAEVKKPFNWATIVLPIAKASGLVLMLALLALGLPLLLPLAWATGRLAFLAVFRHQVHEAVSTAVEPLQRPFREALQRWRWRMADRQLEMTAYAEQVNFVTNVDRSPVLDIAVAEGITQAHGRLGAPEPGQRLRMSILDLLQHVDVKGGSGEGKSRDFYKPLVKQLLELRAKGYPIAIYATDDKAVIGREIAEMARSMGMPEDEVIEIGTGPNDWRVDVLDGLTPVDFADLVRNASAKAGGGDDFWAEMGSDLQTNILYVLQAAERTDQGLQWIKDEGIRLYSIVSLISSVADDEKLMREIEWVLKAVKDPELFPRLHGIHIPALLGAVEYLLTKWLPMVDATRDGISANARKALRLFSVKPELSFGFADGAGERLLPVERIRSNTIRTINISQVEHGSAGRIMLILLKAQLFKLARSEEQADPAGAQRKLAWWFNPDLKDPSKDENFIDVFLADEYQAQAVGGDGGSGINDATIWNVIRSARVAGVILSQSRKAYDQALGETSSGNMLLNFRSKIYFRTEDTATINEIKALGGKALRFQVADWAHHESTAAVAMETGVSPDRLPRARMKASSELITGIKWGIGLMGIVTRARSYEGIESYHVPYEFDDRFVVDIPGADAVQASIASHQSAAWRMEDRNVAALQHLGSEIEIFNEGQVMQMGRGRAIAFLQRGGVTNVDVVRMNAAAQYQASGTLVSVQ